MTDSDDEQKNTVTDGRNEPYRVGNKRPPMHSRFEKGTSGNPEGRPKRRPRFDETLLKEFRKPVAALQDGKPVKTSYDRLFANRLVKSGLKDGPQAAKLLQGLITQAESREVAAEKEAEARRKKEEDQPEVFSWSDEKEKLLREFERQEMEATCKSGSGTNVGSDKAEGASPPVPESHGYFHTTSTSPSPGKAGYKGNRDGS